MDEEVGALVQHGAIAAHAAARRIDAPALTSDVAGPDEGDRTPVDRRGAEMSDAAFAGDTVTVIETHAIEDVLPRRQTVEQQLCGEVAVWQRVGRCRAQDSGKALDRRAFDL